LRLATVRKSRLEVKPSIEALPAWAAKSIQGPGSEMFWVTNCFDCSVISESVNVATKINMTRNGENISKKVPNGVRHLLRKFLPMRVQTWIQPRNRGTGAAIATGGADCNESCGLTPVLVRPSWTLFSPSCTVSGITSETAGVSSYPSGAGGAVGGGSVSVSTGWWTTESCNSIVSNEWVCVLFQPLTNTFKQYKSKIAKSCLIWIAVSTQDSKLWWQMLQEGSSGCFVVLRWSWSSIRGHIWPSCREKRRDMLLDPRLLNVYFCIENYRTRTRSRDLLICMHLPDGEASGKHWRQPVVCNAWSPFADKS
jgi:hypothetical protein